MFTKNLQINKVFSLRLGELMAEYNESQYQLSIALGIKPQSISTYRKGTCLPDTQRLTNIADHYGVSVDWLIGRSNVRDDVPKLREICNATGLSPKALEQLDRDRGDPATTGAFIDYLLSDENACKAISWALSNAGKSAENITDVRSLYDIVADSHSITLQMEAAQSTESGNVSLPAKYAFLFYISQASEVLRDAIEGYASFV